MRQAGTVKKAQAVLMACMVSQRKVGSMGGGKATEISGGQK